MPASAYVADARRKSFMDLPGETRKLIYGYAVFGNRSEDWGIMTSGDRLTCARPQSSDYGPSSRRFNIAFRTSMYGMFCAMRKLVRHEVRAYFWKHLDFKPASHCDLDDFLEDIEIEAHQDFLIKGDPLESVLLEDLLNIIVSLPQLKDVFLSLSPAYSVRIAVLAADPDEFLRFAFSGKRQDALWKAIRQRLGARNTKWEDWNEDTTTDGAKNSRKTNGQVAVRMTRPGWKAEDYIKHAKVMDYQAWLQSSSGPAKTFSQYRCAVEAEEVDGAVTDALQPQKGDIEDGDADEDEDMEDQGENSHEKEHKDGD
ncbi:hypothetical protein SLS61_006245 [Didymella pomorum]